MTFKKLLWVLLALISVCFGDIYINEIGASNDSYINENTNDTPDWLELYNSGTSSVDISGYYLSDNEQELGKYALPAGTTIPAEGFIRFWLTDDISGFKLSKSGEIVILSSPEREILDSITFGEQVTDITYGRYPDGASEFKFFEEITPGAPNSDNFYIAGVVKVDFSMESGFYNSSQSLTLSSETGTIYYTTDGSTPTVKSQMANGPIFINQTTVLKAVALGDEIATEKVYTKTFFINEDFEGIPVFSISLDPEVVTAIYSDFGNNGSSVEETLGYVEMFENGERVLSQKAGVKPFGRGSNAFAQKSMAFYARDSYGKKYFKHSLFPNKPQVEKVKRFVLRNSGNDNGGTMFKDAVIQQIVQGQMEVDYQDYQPAIHFVNGEYYGILNIREKADEHFPKANYGIDNDSIDMISGAIGGKEKEILAGSTTELYNLDRYITSNDLSENQHYNYVTEQIDMLNFIDYQIAEYYIANEDWASNVKQWRPFDKGRWRWILYDLDYGANSAALNFFDHAHGSFYPGWESKLLANNEYRSLFLQRFAAHIAITFKYERVEPFIDAGKSRIAPFISEHHRKWSGSVSGWEGKISELKNFFNGRPNHIYTHIAGKYGTSGMVSLTVQNKTPDAGELYIAAVKVGKDTLSGEFFSNIPVSVTAVAKEGYRFSRWSNGSTDSVLTLVLNTDTLIEAMYNEDTTVKSLSEMSVMNQNPMTITTIGNSIRFENIMSFNTGNTPLSVTVFDVRGREVLKQEVASGTNRFTIPVTDVSDGFHILNVSTTKQTIIKKVLLRD